MSKTTYATLEGVFEGPPEALVQICLSRVAHGCYASTRPVKPDELLSDMILVCSNYYGMSGAGWFLVKQYEMGFGTGKPDEVWNAIRAVRDEYVGGIAIQTQDRGELMPWYWFELEADAVIMAMKTAGTKMA